MSKYFKLILFLTINSIIQPMYNEMIDETNAQNRIQFLLVNLEIVKNLIDITDPVLLHEKSIHEKICENIFNLEMTPDKEIGLMREEVRRYNTISKLRYKKYPNYIKIHKEIETLKKIIINN